MTVEYLTILTTLLIAISVSVFLLLIPFITRKVQRIPSPDDNKKAQYECGFPQMNPSQSQVDIKFYRIAVLFVIFDVEIMLLFPWALHIKELGTTPLFISLFFLLILVVGLIYEFKNKVFNLQ